MVTKNSEKSYSLIAPVSVEYERDKKPMPSGFAKISLTLEPCSENMTLKVVIEANIDDGSWQLLEAHNATTGEVLEVSPEIEKGLWEEALVGINEGAEAALQNYLDLPVRQVKVVVKKIAFHPVYSTIMAFKIASQKAVELALDEARQRGLLVILSNKKEKGGIY